VVLEIRMTKFEIRMNVQMIEIPSWPNPIERPGE
jgi:hypothetical protein